MPDAPREDAAIVVQLAQWASTAGIDEAVAAVTTDDFDAEQATVDDPNVRRVLQWCETIGTLTKNRLLSEELVLDWLWVAGLWQSVGPAALREREKRGVPQLYENFEALAAAQSE